MAAALLGAFCLLLIYADRPILTANCTKKPALPILRSRIPLIGNLFEIVWNLPLFLRKGCQSCGENFATKIGGKTMAFISSPETLDAFYRDRQHALLAFNGAPFVLGRATAARLENVLRTTIEPLIAQGNTEPSIVEIMPAFTRRALPCLVQFHASHKPTTLRELINYTLFCSMTTAVWGDRFPVHTFRDLLTFDETSYFMFSPLSFLMRSSWRAQARVCKALTELLRPWRETRGEKDMDGVSSHGNILMRTLVAAGLSDREASALLLLYIWGMFTNVSRITFWLLAHLLEDRAAYRLLLGTEIDTAFESEFPEPGAIFAAHPSVINGPRFQLLDSAFKESFRLHTLPISYRSVAADAEFPGVGGAPFSVRRGDLVVANTTALYMDGARFADPQTFRVDRFVRDEKAARELSMFGRGAHTCPGRYMGRYFVKMFVILALRRFDVELAPSVARDNFRPPAGNPRSTGVMRPAQDVAIVLEERLDL